MEDLVEKIKKSLGESEYDALVVFGPDNVQYLSGAFLPFLYSYPDRYLAVFWPKGEDPVCVCPVEWESSFLDSSWMGRTRQYVEKPGDPGAIVEALALLVKNTVRKTGRIGLDTDRASSTLFVRLSEALDEFELAPCDGWLRGMRMRKTPGELELLRDVAHRTDHGVLGAAHHVIVTSPRTEMSLGEEVRVHCMERGLDVIGHHSVSQAASGAHSRRFWPLAPKYGLGYDKQLKPGEYVRMEMRASLGGYWSDAARMMTMGEPTEAQALAYGQLVSLREAAIESIRPGARCSEVYEAVRAKAEETEIELVAQIGVGHGVGVADREPPYLTACDDTELEAGMVLVLDPVVIGPDGELMRSKDTVVVTGEGCRVVGWYKDWREPYTAAYTL